ncbi:lyase [Candidatus Nitrosotenuis cloacae]|uniref:Vgb family protein n=1 Tax=Candidatus Nitrosotenuis cloacae TaxID=1603555 RepID=UPI00227E74A5|nr:lyase [Candidatus Nitrosotenuis cloacae]
MKKKIKGIVLAGFFATILLTSTLAIALNSGPQQSPEEKITITGTPEDNIPDLQRPRFCSTGEPESNQYVTEFKIPTKCTMPLAITTDPSGMVWFAQTNTGKIAKFDPQTEYFTEYENPQWAPSDRTMVWGMDYSYDGHVWYTDDLNDSIWKFSTSDGTYEQIPFPSASESLPQHIKVTGNQVIVNDFYGSKISLFDSKQEGAEKTYKNIPSPIPGSFVAGFDIDSQGSVWYTNWMLRQGGALVKFDYNKFAEYTAANNVLDNSTALLFSDAFNLPPYLGTPVGLAVDQSDNIWIADTSSSSFVKFDPVSQEFTKYVTSDPDPSTYGNHTGIIRTPVSGPYWVEINDGRLVFNEQIGNAIAVFDIESESLLEYQVPSKNPNWADCADRDDCGIAQVFGFKAAGDKVWFTEWVENNIGVVDLAKQLPIMMDIQQKQITLQRGQDAIVEMSLTPNYTTEVSLAAKDSSQFQDILVDIPSDVDLSGPRTIQMAVTAKESALPGVYKVLVSARTADVTVSQYVTVLVTP